MCPSPGSLPLRIKSFSAVRLCRAECALGRPASITAWGGPGTCGAEAMTPGQSPHCHSALLSLWTHSQYPSGGSPEPGHVHHRPEPAAHPRVMAWLRATQPQSQVLGAASHYRRTFMRERRGRPSWAKGANSSTPTHSQWPHRAEGASQAESFAKGLAGAPGHEVRDRPPPASSPRTSFVLAPPARTAVRGWRSRVQRRQGCAPCCGTGGQNGLTRGQGGGGLGQKHQGASSGSAPGSPRDLPNTEHESCTLPVGRHCGSTVTPLGAPGRYPSPASQSWSGKEGKSRGIPARNLGRG